MRRRLREWRPAHCGPRGGGGIGGACFLQGVRHAVPDAEVTVVVNTGDDTTLYGLRICPDLDTVMYTLSGGIDTERGCGRQDEIRKAKEELAL